MASHYLRTTSTLDGSPVFVVVSEASRNYKTGAMLQTWILKANVSPQVSVRTGSDSSVCGECPRRWSLGGDCYVVVGRGPLQIWKAVKRNIRGESSLARPLNLDKPPAFLKRQSLRLGAYGDPAAVSFEFWERLMSSLQISRWTGYTHQWRTCDTRFQKLVMASADSESERHEARSLGWRTFRVRGASEPLLVGEFECPASAEQGKRLTCASCLACDGGDITKASPVIIAHGVKNQKGLVSLRRAG